MAAAAQLALFDYQPAEAPATPAEPSLADEIAELMERLVADAERANQELRALHAKILGCSLDELDARIAQEEAEREAARAQRGSAAPAKRSRRAPKSAPDVVETASERIGARRLSERERELLTHLRVDGNVAVYVPKERIPDWDLLKGIMGALGGAWRARKGFVFPEDADARELLRLALETGEVLDPRAADFFETPDELADHVVQLAGIRPGDRVLEPSAGRGAIARAVRRACPDAIVACVEPLPAHRAALDRDGFELIGEDFLQLTPELVGEFDAITANPPFSRRADIAHVEHMLRFLRTGGSLVSIMSAGVEYRDDRRARAFRDHVAARGGRFERNPDGSFLSSGTGVRTVTLVIPRRSS